MNISTKHLLAGFLSVACLFNSQKDACAEQLDQWTWLNPRPTVNPLNATTFNSGRFVAVGDFGNMFTSTNGTDWIQVFPGTTNRLTSITANGSLFVAAGERGTIVTSDNGVDWIPQATGITNDLYGITYSNSTFLAVGSAGSIIVSSGGIMWETRDSGVSCSLRDVAYGNGIFSAVGTSPSTFLRSTDTINWTAEASPLKSLDYITYGNGTFVAHGFYEHYLGLMSYDWNEVFMTSASASGWTNTFVFDAALNYSKVRPLRFVNNKFIAKFNYPPSGLTTLWTSLDGHSWTNDATSGLPDEASDISYGNSAYVAPSLLGSVYVSPAGTNWTEATPSYRDTVNGIAYGIGYYVAVGGVDPFLHSGNTAAILSSSNGTSFSYIETNVAVLTSVAFGNGVFVAVGTDGLVQRSTNATSWVTRPSGVTSRLNAVAYGSGTNVWIAVGNSGKIESSSDNGLIWVARNSTVTYTLNGVTYGQGQFVVVGQLGTILTSVNGIDWTQHYVDTLNDLMSVDFGYAGFVAVGIGGTIATSPDGETWTVQNSGTATDLYRVNFGSGNMVALGQHEAFSSYDGTNWISRFVGTSTTLKGSSFLNHRFLFVGMTGVIAQSDPYGEIRLENRLIPSMDMCELNIYGDAGSDYRVQYSPDLNDDVWTDLAEYTNAFPVETFVHTNSSMFTQLYFRVISP